MIVITSHAALIKGKVYEALASTLIKNLCFLEKDFLFIRHYMNGEKQSEYFLYKK
jgi:hypothetical protein